MNTANLIFYFRFRNLKIKGIAVYPNRYIFFPIEGEMITL